MVVRGVIGENGGSVKRAIIFGEVELQELKSDIGNDAAMFQKRLTQHLSPILSGRSPRTPTPMTWVDE